MKLSTSERQSNFELLRLVAMLLVVVVHMDFYSLGWPTFSDAETEPGYTFLKILIESFSIVCVDVFVLISGWFGINPNKKSIFSLLYQTLFLFLLITLILISFGEKVPIKFFFTGIFYQNYWFVFSYIGLYIVSPILNSYIRAVDKDKLKVTVVLFLVFEFICGWAFDVCGFEKGYSLLAFIGLYLLARYVRLYSESIISFSAIKDVLLYVGICSISTIISFALLRFKVTSDDYMFRYTSPFVVMASLFLLLTFSRLRFKSTVVNFLAASVFSIYLFHQHPIVASKFQGIIRSICIGGNSVEVVAKLTLVLVVIFVVSIFLDQVRKLSWKLVSSRIWKE